MHKKERDMDRDEQIKRTKEKSRGGKKRKQHKEEER